MTKTLTTLPSGRVMCCIQHDSGSIVCTSDDNYGDYAKRAENASKKASEAYQAIHCNWSQPMGKMVDVVV